MISALPCACGAPPPAPPARLAPAPEVPPPLAAPPPVVEPPLACVTDADCGYDPTRGRCTADPRANRQPPLRDQGLVCYCEGRCATQRVDPVPCESDASCAVSADPRPHPVAASAAHPHERGRACRDFLLATTCERTNLCTMHRLRCP